MRLNSAFTLVELLIATVVLSVLVLLVTRLFTSASAIATLGTKRMETGAQVRPLFERMAMDFSQMVKRSDVQVYVKQPASATSSANTFAGNDRIAFYAAVPGDYPSTGSESPFSLVAYKVNSSTAVANAAVYTRFQRMARGLLMNGASSDVKDGPLIFGPTAIKSVWPTVDSNATTDSKYEVAGPQVFRFEYYYQLTNGSLSIVPWDASIAGHTDVSGLRDVSAIVVAIATIDPRSRVLLTNAKVATIGSRLPDYASSMGPGRLATEWQGRLDTDSQIAAMPRAAITGIRISERAFQLPPIAP
jgi:prepilin-type N-terminal cleavage/methylation domain-containing protein